MIIVPDVNKNSINYKVRALEKAMENKAEIGHEHEKAEIVGLDKDLEAIETRLLEMEKRLKALEDKAEPQDTPTETPTA